MIRRSHLILLSLIGFLVTIRCGSPASSGPAYLDWRKPIPERVDDLLSRMTLAEKISQMRYDAPAIDRLGVPAYNWWNECLHGVARAGRATVFPQAIGLAATWDEDLLHRVASAIGDEARAKHHAFARRGKRGLYQGLTFWTPNINLLRDPRWGRGMETYGEDPFLTGRLAVNFVQGLQGDDPRYLKTVATLKHFAVHSGPEPDRHVFDARVSDRDLYESYLPHFRMGILEGHARSVMCAYNRFRGEPCCGSSPLIQNILRDEWGFDGYVVSDCWALSDFHDFHKVTTGRPESAALALKAGTDLNCGTVYRDIQQAIGAGLVDSTFVDMAVRRLFTARFQLGMFDPPERVRYAQIPYSFNDCKAHRALALETARKSLVLLKNDGVLPLSKTLKSIAVIGPNADDVEPLLANYNGIPTNPITPFRGIREVAGPEVAVHYAQGCDLAEGLPHLTVVPDSVLSCQWRGESHRGLHAAIFNNRDLTGEPVETHVDGAIDFNWWDGAPLDTLNDDDFGVVWTGTLTPPVDGEHVLGGWGSTFRLFADDSLVASNRNAHEPGHHTGRLTLRKGVPVRLRLEFFEEGGDAEMRLVWAPPRPHLLDEALAVAAESEAVVLVLGLSPRLEGEALSVSIPGFHGGDRLSLALPEMQIRLMKAVHALGKPTVLVLLGGGSVNLGWADANLPAIVQAWYPGQAGGRALAEALLGEVNPGGRLPVTFYRDESQLPYFSDYAMAGRTYRFFQGEPLYPFGYGLSYSRFEYTDLSLPEQTDFHKALTISVRVINRGPLDGDEVVQLYVRDVEASSPVARRSLAGFKRIHLKAGESQKVRFRLSARQCSLIDDDGQRLVEPGRFEVSVGGGQEGLHGAFDYTGAVRVLPR